MFQDLVFLYLENNGRKKNIVKIIFILFFLFWEYKDCKYNRLFVKKSFKTTP